MSTTRTRSYLVYILPSLHFCACAVVALAKPDAWGALFLIDLPFSVLIAARPWHYPIPPWLAFGVLGTLWWYFLSLLIQKFIVRHPDATDHGKPTPLRSRRLDPAWRRRLWQLNSKAR